MKIFHTADWHLGKLVKETRLTEDQRYVLRQFVDAAREERPDAIVIAGDLYDRSVPPLEAVELFNDILIELIIDLNIPVLAIAGNHDSPERVEFAHSIMEKQGLHLRGKITEEHQPVVLRDEHGPVHFHLVPFADPAQIRHLFEDEDIRTHDDAMRVLIERIERTMDPNARHVFVGHAFVTPTGEDSGYERSSERPLSIGGAEFVRASRFQPFHYVALGHLHRGHAVGDEKIQYPGSPLKYSISEERHEKGFLVVHLDGDGRAQTERRRLRPRRDMRTVEATLAEIERHPRSEDYVFVQLLDEDVVLFPMEKIRAVYPNAMHVGRKLAWTPASDEFSPEERKKMDPFALFQSFAKEMTGREPTEEMNEIFLEALQQSMKGDKTRV